MMKFIVAVGPTTILAGAALPQTTAAPPPAGSGSRGIGPAPRTSEPVTPGTSSTPGPAYPDNAKKSLDSPGAGGSGAGAGGSSN